MRWKPRFFSVFLIVLLAAGLLALPTRAEDGDSYFVSIEVHGRNVLFLNEQVNLNVTSNASTVQLIIYDNENIIRYNGNVTANTTFQWTPTAVYGTFTAKANVTNATSETWFWLQDTTGLANNGVVNSWTYQNTNYTLTEISSAGKVSTYNLTVTLQNRVFTTEWLSEVFSKLKPTTVQLQKKPGIYRVITYSDKNKIDSWIMNTCFGVKIRVNGTLESVTTFKWNFGKDNGILWGLNSFRLNSSAGNIVYDYSDLYSSASTGVSATIDKTGLKLDVTFQTAFDADPTIFSDGFESGNYSAWTSTVTAGAGAVAVASDQKHHGSYSSKSTWNSSGDSAYCYKTITATNLFYTRFYAYIDNRPVTAWTRFEIFHVRDTAGAKDIFTLEVYQRAAGTYVWRIGYRSASGSTFVEDSDMVIAADTWTCIEAKVDLSTADGNTDGSYEVWVNGTSIWNVSSVDTDSTTANEVRCGLTGNNDANPNSMWQDCIVIADAYIGVETAFVNYILDLAWASSLTYTLATQTAYTNVLVFSFPGTYTTASNASYGLALSYSASVGWTYTATAAYALALTWNASLSWVVDLWTGVSYILDLAWATALSWSLGFTTTALAALDVLGVAAFALIIALTVLGLLCLVLFKRKEKED